MADSAALTSQELFKKWRSGDASAGQAMAQRFSDWYYAITAARLGDLAGREPLERACQSFAEGIVQVTRPSELESWAHGLMQRELTTAGMRRAGGDQVTALTMNRTAGELLRNVAGRLDPRDIAVLDGVYGGRAPLDRLHEDNRDRGGLPTALHRARTAAKRALRELGVPFASIPDADELDWIPIGFYESANMASTAEDDAFELWMLSDPRIVKDVAEFSAFVHAMRAGALAVGARGDSPRTEPRQEAVRNVPSRLPTQHPEDFDQDEAPAPRSFPVGAVAIAAAAVVIAVIAVVALAF